MELMVLTGCHSEVLEKSNETLSHSTDDWMFTHICNDETTH